jgi:hypothetical protein
MTATVTVVAAPAITSFSAAPAAVSSGGSSTLTAVFSGGTGTVDHSLGAVTTGAGLGTGSINATTTYTLTVTNAANDSVTAQTTVAVVSGPPAIASFTATPAIITLGKSSTLAWTLSGQPATTLTIDQGVGEVTAAAGSSIQVSPTTATTYTLTATNAKGSVQATASVRVVFAATITSFKASPTTVLPGATSTLTAVFTQGTGVITPGLGTVSSGTGLATAALATGTTYTLTVTNAAGDAVQQQLRVHVDPGTFTAAGNGMLTGRTSHTSTLLPNGKVMVVGGTAGSLLADEFDPTAFGGLGGFTASNNGMAVVRLAHSSVLLPNGKVLVLGGYNPSAALPRQLSSADLYDPSIRAFAPSANHMATARQQCTATLLFNGKVLITGGFNDTLHALGTAELYDPATDTFQTSTGTLGTPRWGHLATLLPNGKVLLVGGGGGTNPPAGELYDPQADSFVPTGDPTMAVQWDTATLLPTGQVLLALTGNANTATSLLYNPATGLGTATTGTPDSSRLQAPTATLMGDGHVLLAGNLGLPGFDVPGDCETFSPSTGLYAYTGNPGDRWQQCASLLPDGRVMLVGGYATSIRSVLATATLFNAGPAVPSPAASATVAAPVSATTGTTGHIASVPVATGATYYWTLTNGTFTSGLGTASVTFTAGSAGALKVDCLVVNPYGIPSHGSATVTVTP